MFKNLKYYDNRGKGLEEAIDRIAGISADLDAADSIDVLMDFRKYSR
ncbi:MAG: hypothetical protein U5K79_13080 [Cyclobacteriaceae bacterium]|nr:hypothetical protein [Cyclobacteriaceae bacterium]